MALAIARGGDHEGWLPLVEVAVELGVTRSAVYEMVRQERLEGRQQGSRWLVPRTALTRFKADWVPAPNAGRRLTRRADGPKEVLSLLQDWRDGRVEELAEAMGRHPGNVRKYLRILEVRGLAQRQPEGDWVPTQSTGEENGF